MLLLRSRLGLHRVDCSTWMAAVKSLHLKVDYSPRSAKGFHPSIPEYIFFKCQLVRWRKVRQLGLII